MRENLLPRVLSIKIICVGFGHSRETGEREEHASEKRKASVRTYKTYVQKPEVYILLYIYTPRMYTAHTHAHAPLGFNPQKKYESSSSWSI